MFSFSITLCISIQIVPRSNLCFVFAKIENVLVKNVQIFYDVNVNWYGVE